LSAGASPAGAGSGSGPAPPQADDGDARRLLRGAAAELGLPLRDEQIESLLRYLALLQRWNSTYNLTAVRDPDSMLTQHLVDCLAAVAALERSGFLAQGGRILDVGSGGGLPGVLLALHRPDWQVTSLDAVGKKAAFVRQVAGALRLANLHAVHARVEAWRSEPFQLITARAFSSLADLVRLTRHLLLPAGQWMAMKGQRPESELAELAAQDTRAHAGASAPPPSAGVDVFHVEPLAVPGLDAQRCLVWMRPRAAGSAAPPQQAAG